MRKRAVKSVDPARSLWWVVQLAVGALVGFGPYMAGAWDSVVGTVVGGVIAVVVAVTPWFREYVSARARGRNAAIAAGAAGTVAGAASSPPRVHASDWDTSEFVARDLECELRDHLERKIPVVVEGPSMAGKTRLVLHALNALLPTAPLWFPTGDGDIERLLRDDQSPARNSVVFLDDMDRFLSNQSLTLNLVEQWRSAGCTVVATMTSSQYERFRDQAEAKLPGWDALNRFARLRLRPLLSDGELEAVRGTGYASHLSSIRDVGLAPFLGGAPRARERFREDREAHR